MALDPLLDVVELEAEMASEPIVGDRVIVSSRRASVDEGLRNAQDSCDLIDAQIARRDVKLQLFRLLQLRISCHVVTLNSRESEGIKVAKSPDLFLAFAP